MKDLHTRAQQVTLRGPFFVLVTAANVDNRTFTMMRLLKLVTNNKTVLYQFLMIGKMQVTVQNAFK
jgi:hypothetical protein